MEVIFSTKARKDVKDAYDWYETKQHGLGKKFVAEVIENSKKLGRDIIEYRIYISVYQTFKIPIFYLFYK